MSDLFRIGGVRLAISAPAGALDPSYQGYAVPAATPGLTPDFTLEVRLQDPSGLPENVPKAQAELVWDDPRLRLRGEGFEGELDFAAGAGWLRQGPGSTCYRVAVQLILARRLLSRRGFLVHGAGVVREGRGFLFVGPSGAGKTTVAGLGGLPILSDETCLVRIEEDGAALAGTPVGWTTAAGPVPLAGVYWLEQAPEDATEDMSGAAAFRRLAEQTIALGLWGEDGLGDSLAALIERVPVRRLRFTKSDRFLRWLGD